MEASRLLREEFKFTHWWRPPVCPGASPARWWGGGRSICRPRSLWLWGCLATAPESWRTALMWAAEYSSCATGRPPCRWLVAMTAPCTGTYWPNRWGGGLRPLWPPPAAVHWSLQGRLRETRSGWKKWQERRRNVNKIHPFTDLLFEMNEPSQFLDMWVRILTGAWNQGSWFHQSSIF